MLYISRYLYPIRVGGLIGYKGMWSDAGEIRYGVVDTDDNVEQIVTSSQLWECHNKGIDIQGVYLERGRFIHAVPYQDSRYMTKFQTKLLVMNHVDIRVYKKAITSITWDSSKISSPVSIRLSNFGSRLADYALYNAVHSGKHDVTFILDNRIKFSKWSFLTHEHIAGGLEGAGVLFDVCDVGNPKRADIVYKAVKDSGSDISSIMDDPVRHRDMERVYGR